MASNVTKERLIFVLAALLEWEARMGGWDSGAWRVAREIMAEHHTEEAQRKGAEQMTLDDMAIGQNPEHARLVAIAVDAVRAVFRDGSVIKDITRESLKEIRDECEESISALAED